MNPQFLQMLMSMMSQGGGFNRSPYPQQQGGYSPWGGSYWGGQQQQQAQGDPWGSYARNMGSMDRQAQTQNPQAVATPEQQASNAGAAASGLFGQPNAATAQTRILPAQLGGVRTNMMRAMQRY